MKEIKFTDYTLIKEVSAEVNKVIQDELEKSIIEFSNKLEILFQQEMKTAVINLLDALIETIERINRHGKPVVFNDGNKTTN